MIAVGKSTTAFNSNALAERAIAVYQAATTRVRLPIEWRSRAFGIRLVVIVGPKPVKLGQIWPPVPLWPV